MPSEVVTLGDLTEQVSLIITNAITTDSQITSQIHLALHAALRDFVRISEPLSFRTDIDFDITAGTSTYTVNGSICKIIDPGVTFVTSDYRTLAYANEQTIKSQEWDRWQRTGEPQWYVIRNRDPYVGDLNLRLYPTPTTDRTLRVHVLTLPLKLWPNVSSSQVVDPRLPPEFHHCLIAGAITNLPRYLNSQLDLAAYAAKWQQYIEQAKDYQIPVTGQAYQRDAYKLLPTYGNRAYGWQDPTITPG